MKLIKYLLLVVGGMLYAWGFPIKGIPSFFLAPVFGTTIFLFYLFKAKTFGKRFLIMYFFNLGIYLLGYYWIPHTFSEFGNIPFPFNHALGLVFCLIISPHYLLLVILITLYKRHGGKIDRYIPRDFGFRVLLLSIFFTLLEYFTPTQFPAHLGHAWMQLAPGLGLAPVFGVPIFSFMSFWMLFAILDFLDKKRINRPIIILFPIFLVINQLIPLQFNQKGTKKIHLRLVQANIGNFLKITSEKGEKNSLENVYKKYFHLSTMPSKKPIDLIIWPETAYPISLFSKYALKYEKPAPRLIREIMAITGSEMLIGGYDMNSPRRNGNFEMEYNTAFHFHFSDDGIPQMKETYHKMKLIPFGETLPFGFLTKPMSKIINNISYFKSGQKFTLFETKNKIRFTAAICYEILFPEFIRMYLANLSHEPHFIMNLTNDSWYGDTSEPYQHLFLAKWRALELGIPIVRMTNTGISSILYPDGSESARTGIYTEEKLDVELYLDKTANTTFKKWGLIPLYLFWMLLIAGYLIYQKRHRPVKIPHAKDHEAG